MNFDKSAGMLFKASSVKPQEKAASPRIGSICEELFEEPLASPKAKERALPA
ncbi:Uncharacterised protein [Chlamydia trachomatis]|nr:Uncharacterised protein [Chlamydia trachomatis]CRH62708.1 Uncharacterised protein [Chlamydia trachomatis]CRH88583.1 Uncharacterised protein [Chlamydia trachomatis]